MRAFVSLILFSVVLISCQAKETATSSSQNGLAFQSSSSSSSSAGGNGEFYGGKPTPGLYVRQLPGLNCGPQNFGEILVSKTGITGTFVNPQDCSVTKTDLSNSPLEYSSYLKNRVGLLDGIYTAKQPHASGNVIEAWCRRSDSTAVTGIDVTIEANYLRRQYFARVSSAMLGKDGQVERTETYEPLEVKRLSPKPERAAKGADDVVKYSGANSDFHLAIEPKTYDLATGKMKAVFIYRLQGFNIDMHWFCRLGGELDTKSLKPLY